jgi:hypothetical protein
VNTEFEIPGYIAAAILLSTLPSDPGDPHDGIVSIKVGIIFSFGNLLRKILLNKRTFYICL